MLFITRNKNKMYKIIKKAITHLYCEFYMLGKVNLFFFFVQMKIT